MNDSTRYGGVATADLAHEDDSRPNVADEAAWSAVAGELRGTSWYQMVRTAPN